MALPGLFPPASGEPDDYTARLLADQAAALEVAPGGTTGGGAQLPAMGTPTQTPSGPAIIQLPEQSTRIESGQSTTKRTEMDPRRTAAIDDQKFYGDAEVQAKIDQRDLVDVPRAQLAQKEAEAEANEHRRHQQELAEARAKQDQEIAKKQAEYDGRRRQLEAAAEGRATSFWADKGKPAEILSRFIVMTADHSHKMAGNAGPSPVSQSLDAALAEDRAIKMAKFENSKEFLALSKEDVGAAQRAKAAKEAEVKDHHQVMLNSIKARFKAYAAKLGTPEAQAKADAEIAQIQQKQAKLLADQYKDADVETSYTSGKTTTTINVGGADPTAAQSKPSTEDINKRGALEQQEAAAREIQRIAKEHPEAVSELQRAETEWAKKQSRKEFPLGLGKASTVISEMIGEPTSKDGFLRDASPEARRLNELVEGMATARAKALGGAVTDGDRQAIKSELGILGKNAGEISSSAGGYADQAARQREALEAHKAFADRTRDARTDGRQEALGNLLRAHASGDREAVRRAAEAARAVGVPEATVSALEGSVRR